MARVGLTFSPRDGERDIVHTVLGKDARWLVDDPSTTGVEVAMVWFPRKDLRKLGLDWSAFPDLRLIQATTAGLNHMGWRDLPDVPVAATPGATAPFIAEYVLGAIIGWSRGFLRHTQDIRKGRFDLGAPVRALSELRVGLVGYGGIGKAVARILAPHGVRLEAVSRSGRGDELVPDVATMDGLAAMAGRVDALVLGVPLTKETEGLIDIDILSGMTGRPALLVNVSRGPVVKEADLFAWLDSSHTKHAAALDVWWQYPIGEGFPFSEAFHALPNVLMTPHNSPNVTGFRDAMLRQACGQVRQFLETGVASHVHARGDYETRSIGDGR